MMEDFYIYLPSNTTFLQENKSNSYVTKLSKEISLDNSWECALKEIHYPRTWATLLQHECFFVIEKMEWGTAFEERRLQAGFYSSPEHLINTLSAAVQNDDVVFTYSEAARQLISSIPTGTKIHFTEPLSSMLGIGHGATVCTSRTQHGTYPIDLSRGIDTLYVYTDIIRTKLVGDSAVPLLRVVPVQGDYGTMVFKEYSSPVYSELSKNTFTTVQMYITDSAGRDIPFGYGKVTCLLHFRKRQR